MNSELFRNSPLFRGLGEKAIGELVRISTLKKFAKDEMIFNEGERAEALYVVAKGTVHLTKSSPDGKVQIIREVNKGETFAEAAMFSGSDYPVTAITRNKTELMMIKKSAFLSLIKRNPELALSIMGVLSNLLRHLNRLLSDLSLGTVSDRLAAYLLKRSKEIGMLEFSLGIRKNELAQRLGTIPETLSRQFRKLQDDELIENKGDIVKILSIESLREQAGLE